MKYSIEFKQTGLEEIYTAIIDEMSEEKAKNLFISNLNSNGFKLKNDKITPCWYKISKLHNVFEIEILSIKSIVT